MTQLESSGTTRSLQELLSNPTLAAYHLGLVYSTKQTILFGEYLERKPDEYVIGVQRQAYGVIHSSLQNRDLYHFMNSVKGPALVEIENVPIAHNSCRITITSEDSSTGNINMIRELIPSDLAEKFKSDYTLLRHYLTLAFKKNRN